MVVRRLRDLGGVEMEDVGNGVWEFIAWKELLWVNIVVLFKLFE